MTFRCRRTKFTEEGEEHLRAWIAAKIPYKDIRGRIYVYNYTNLYGRDPKYGWVTRHSWQSWREHYKRHSTRLDIAIEDVGSREKSQVKGEICDPISQTSLTILGRGRLVFDEWEIPFLMVVLNLQFMSSKTRMKTKTTYVMHQQFTVLVEIQEFVHEYRTQSRGSDGDPKVPNGVSLVTQRYSRKNASFIRPDSVKKFYCHLGLYNGGPNDFPLTRLFRVKALNVIQFDSASVYCRTNRVFYAIQECPSKSLHLKKPQVTSKREWNNGHRFLSSDIKKLVAAKVEPAQLKNGITISDPYPGGEDDPQRALQERAELRRNRQSNDFTTTDDSVSPTLSPANNKLRIELSDSGTDPIPRVYPVPASDQDHRKLEASNLFQPPRPFLLRGSSAPQLGFAPPLGPSEYSSPGAPSQGASPLRDGHFPSGVPSHIGNTRNRGSTQIVESARCRADIRGRRIFSQATAHVVRDTPRHVDAYGRHVIVAAGSGDDSEDLFDGPNYPTSQASQEQDIVHKADITVSDSDSDDAATHSACKTRPAIHLGVIDISDSDDDRDHAEAQDSTTTSSAGEIRPPVYLGLIVISDSESDDGGPGDPSKEQSAKPPPRPAALTLCSSLSGFECSENDDGAGQDVTSMDSENEA
ncbi:hypothetical protein GALMADRAFT_1345907 [Galerina marginata CBS 339.88]|uniref:Rap1 Myb domain-containing protein n=1 Tax=Galerina marginata (strain CBS 339.88) TaxID=685588 RepID=A0A067SW79_GALM3|nr:hypothetical protein GALMADRAFT_1345907 [Galerina marginata CBS 339.88]